MILIGEEYKIHVLLCTTLYVAIFHLLVFLNTVEFQFWACERAEKLRLRPFNTKFSRRLIRACRSEEEKSLFNIFRLQKEHHRIRSLSHYAAHRRKTQSALSSAHQKKLFSFFRSHAHFSRSQSSLCESLGGRYISRVIQRFSELFFVCLVFLVRRNKSSRVARVTSTRQIFCLFLQRIL